MDVPQARLYDKSSGKELVRYDNIPLTPDLVGHWVIVENLLDHFSHVIGHDELFEGIGKVEILHVSPDCSIFKFRFYNMWDRYTYGWKSSREVRVIEVLDKRKKRSKPKKKWYHFLWSNKGD